MRDYKNYRLQTRVAKKKRNLRRLAGLFKAFFLAGFLAGLWFFAEYAYTAVSESQYFRLASITVDGMERVGEEEIVALTGAKAGDKILSMDLDRIALNLETHPWIETASVRRILPRGLSIEVTERVPFALLAEGGGYYYVDRGGTPFKKVEQGDSASYPVVGGLSRKEIINDESARTAILNTLDFIETDMGQWPGELAASMISVDKRRGITMASEGMSVRVGFGEYRVKLDRLKRVLEDLKARNRPAEYIDLTYAGQVVVK